MKNIKESICIKNELMFLAAKPGTLALFTSSFLFFVIEGHVSRLSGKSDVPTPPPRFLKSKKSFVMIITAIVCRQGVMI